MTRKPDQRGVDKGRHHRREWRAVFDSVLPVIIACLVVTLAILSVLSVGVWSNARNAKEAAHKARVAAGTARTAIIRAQLTARNGCERVQLVRDDVNVTAWGVYALLNEPQPDAKKYAELFAKLDPDTRAVLLALVQGNQGTRDLMKRVRDEQRYLPPTNCAEASKNPRYRFPQPVPFEQVARCYDPDTSDRIMGGKCRR